MIKIIMACGVHWFIEMNCILKDFMIRREDKRIRVIDTSYEIVWATLRRAPSREYFELDDHPAPRRVYTFNLDNARNIRIE
jgi:hypothetical protein